MIRTPGGAAEAETATKTLASRGADECSWMAGYGLAILSSILLAIDFCATKFSGGGDLEVAEARGRKVGLRKRMQEAHKEFNAGRALELSAGKIDSNVACDAKDLGKGSSTLAPHRRRTRCCCLTHRRFVHAGARAGENKK